MEYLRYVNIYAEIRLFIRSYLLSEQNARYYHCDTFKNVSSERTFRIIPIVAYRTRCMICGVRDNNKLVTQSVVAHFCFLADANRRRTSRGRNIPRDSRASHGSHGFTNASRNDTTSGVNVAECYLVILRTSHITV